MPRKKVKPDIPNPFVQTLVINARWKVETAYLSGGRTISSKPVEIDHYTTVYNEKTLALFKTLPVSSKDMFMWVSAHLNVNSDYLEINPDKYCKEMGVSSRTFYTALDGLRNRVIVPRESRANTYFINPQYLYRGSRISMYRDNVVTVNGDPLAAVAGKSDIVSDSDVLIAPVGMTNPDMFDVASPEPDRT